MVEVHDGRELRREPAHFRAPPPLGAVLRRHHADGAVGRSVVRRERADDGRRIVRQLARLDERGRVVEQIAEEQLQMASVGILRPERLARHDVPVHVLPARVEQPPVAAHGHAEVGQRVGRDHLHARAVRLHHVHARGGALRADEVRERLARGDEREASVGQRRRRRVVREAARQRHESRAVRVHPVDVPARRLVAAHGEPDRLRVVRQCEVEDVGVVLGEEDARRLFGMRRVEHLDRRAPRVAVGPRGETDLRRA